MRLRWAAPSPTWHLGPGTASEPIEPMSTTNKTGRVDGADRVILFGMRAVLIAVLFPAITLLAAMVLAEGLVRLGVSQSHEVGGVALVTVVGASVGLIASVLAARKSTGVLRQILEAGRPRAHEPLASCIEFGVAGAVLAGGVMLAGILFLGHARPSGWSLERTPFWMGISLVVGMAAGLPVGLLRRRRR